MPESLYLLETRAARDCTCEGCKRLVQKGEMHFRHDPFPPARIHRGLKVTHWCSECIAQANPGPKEMVTRRIRIPITHVRSANGAGDSDTDQSPWQPLQIALVGIGPVLMQELAANPALLYQLSPSQFEELICDRLFAMGMEPRPVGKTNQRDGGVDIVFWPRKRHGFPFLGAAQIKHHRDPKKKEGPARVRDFAGVVAGHSFNAGLVVTNTSFTPDALWFAREHARLLKLRDFSDLSRWLVSNFNDDLEWREMPKTIELCPGVVVKIG
jgi:hypothetical protein